jgi:GNAT superfamily N-acetyltransferase
MVPLSERELAGLRPLCDTEHATLVVEAVLAGTTPGRAWADHPGAPTTALVWDGAHSVHLLGALDDPDACRAALDREIRPLRHGVLKFATAAPEAFAATGWPLRERVLYRGHGGAPDLPAAPPGCRVDPIIEGYPHLRALAGFDAVRAEIELCWGTLASFQRAGFGFCAHDGASILGWCTAEHVSEGRCGIGIETVAEHQGRGIATATAAAFLRHCGQRGLRPYWDAWATNTPSIAVAEKVGLRRVEIYPVLVGSFTG